MRRLLRIFPLLLLSGCSGQLWHDSPERLVIEGWIGTDEQPVVMVTTTAAPSTDFQHLSGLYDHVIRWAKVSISDGTQTVVMMGKDAKDYLTGYIYTTGWMLGEAGKTYTLTVEYKDYKAVATTTVPAPVPLEGLRAVAAGEAKFTVTATFTDPPAPGHYYRLFSKVDGKDGFFVPCFLGTLSDGDLSGETEVEINGGQTLMRRTFMPQFDPGDRVHVRLCTMDEPAWRYWNAFEQVSSMSTSPVFPVRFNLPSNVEGGIGYWAGYGVSEGVVVAQ